MSNKKEEQPLAVKFAGESIILPDKPKKMEYNEAIAALEAQRDFEEEIIDFTRSYPGFHFLEMCLKATQVITKRFGWIHPKTIRTLFGSISPSYLGVPTSTTTEQQALVSQFWIAPIEAMVQPMSGTPPSLIVKTRQKNRELIESIFEEIQQGLIRNSIYKGQAIVMPENCDDAPQFFDVSTYAPENLVFNDELESHIRALVYGPIVNTANWRPLGLKRVFLFAGTYGTGKTRLALSIGHQCVKNGWTHIQVKNVEHLVRALEFAKVYQPAVVSAEDIDQTMSGTDRTSMVNECLNTLDGALSKNDEIITVLTTNHPERITPAMRRAGRTNVFLSIDPPDNQAAQRLVALYGGERLVQDFNFEEVGQALAGKIPAAIREIVVQAAAYAMELRGESMIDSSDVLLANKFMKKQQDWAAAEPEDNAPQITFDSLLRQLFLETQRRAKNRIAEAEENILEQIHQINS